MASQSKHRRFFRNEDEERRIEYQHEEINKIELKKLYNYMHDLYGIEPKVLDAIVLLKKGKDVWITTKHTQNILAHEKKFTINSLGMRAIRNAFDVPKLTTNFVIFLNDKITKNYYDMNDQELEDYIHGYEFKSRYNNDFKNYLIMKYKNVVYGVGLISNDVIKSQVPKGRKLKNQLNQKEIYTEVEED